jgi:hypothetical protein
MGGATTATARVRPKEFHFPLSVEWVVDGGWPRGWKASG